MKNDTKQKRGIIGEEELKVKRRIVGKTPARPKSEPAKKPPPTIMETETQQKRYAKDEMAGNSHKKNDWKIQEEVA